MDKRREQLRTWIAATFERLGIDLTPDWSLDTVSGDASFRRYFRVRSHNLSWIAVDAPPDKEDSAPFVAIARAWEPLEIHAPKVHEADLTQGFMLLSDLGDELYLPHLNAHNADQLYHKAMLTLTHIQQCRSILGKPLPPYDEALLKREMALFGDWFVTQLLGQQLGNKEQNMLAAVEQRLVDSALDQPQVCVHRDYHSRNLMVTAEATPGVIDFQDAVLGPVTYDLVSLLRDCYIQWPEEQVESWALRYQRMAEEATIMAVVPAAQFLRWFDLMGMQRHLKVLGIFARLMLRDGKVGYLKDIPLTFHYLLSVGERYPEFAGLSLLLRERLLPAMAQSGYFDAKALEAIG
ncbi:aminoglycoside phosphotransferase family protein [Motiliproteus sediminis]|uniref:aminoglycoside phosphotransferase family protein n=1 Tax=Motiliproteus sediminis TaxID=1468178 RepID=UPI001AEFC924|nr:phosphotransferase [Motiliproteus sediminis]